MRLKIVTGVKSFSKPEQPQPKKSKFLSAVFSVELEWFGNPYPNNLNPIKFDNQPVPLSSFANEKTVQYMNIHSDDWKWSVYARKTFKDNFFVMAQAASDHFRWYRLDFTAMDGKEASRQRDHWYYTLKFGYKF